MHRLYHHTETCLPVHPKELDIDSEGESDPLWLRQKTIQMIDEFSDVNEGEKELMKLWNLHVMKHGYVGDCQLPLACEMFLDVKGHEIIRKNLYRNFILHMCSLFDYGLVAPETVYKVVQKLQGMLSKYAEGQELMSAQRASQLKYWLAVGVHKEDEQKLKSPQKQNPVTMALPTPAVGTSGVAVGGVSVTDVKTSMNPPVKRSATAVKRASMHPQNGLNGNNPDNGNGNGTGKRVAKKSVMQNSLTDLSSRERRASDVTGKRSIGVAATSSVEREKESISLDVKVQAVKRKLLAKDAVQTALASKRPRTDNHSSAIASLNFSINTNESRTFSIVVPERLLTRRQSVTGLGSNNKNHNNSNASRKCSRRTRLSMPLKKPDKR